MAKILERFDKGNGRWAATGSKDTIPTDLTLAKIAEGWVGGENADRPAIETLNKIQNRVESKIDLVIESGPAANYPELTEAQIQAQLCTGLFSNDWGSTDATNNQIYGGSATKEYVDMAVAFTATGDKRILVLDQANNTVDVFDPVALSLVDTSDAFTDDLPSGGGEVWVPMSFCVDADSTHIYVLFKDSNPAPDEWRIQSWLISDWSVNSGWDPGTAEGIGITDTGNGDETQIFIADSTHLCIVQNWVTITAATDDALILHLISDGTFVRGGAGDGPVDSVEAMYACSDGTNIYFVGDGATNGYVCSATIADLETGGGVANYPLTISANHSNGVICSAGELIASVHDISTYTESDFVLYSHSADDATLEKFERGASQNGADGKTFILKRVNDIIFDGINLWILGSIENRAAAGEPQMVLVKIDAAKMSRVLVNAAGQIGLNDIASGVFYISPGTYSDSSTPTNIRCVYDGRDIWVNPESRASKTNSGYIMRLPLALLRH